MLSGDGPKAVGEGGIEIRKKNKREVKKEKVRSLLLTCALVRAAALYLITPVTHGAR